MPQESFKIGDQVRVCMTGAVLGGTCGVIHSKSYMVPSSYFVLFDGWPEVRLMHARDLETLAEENSPSAMDTPS